MDLRRCLVCHLTVELEAGRLSEAVACRCGAMIPPASSTAGILYCPFCSAPVPRGSHRCDHCSSSLRTLRCPACFSLEFVGGKHCSHCGAGLEALAEAEALGIRCPRCDEALVGQPMGGGSVASCGSCGGLWLDHATFGKLRAARAQQAAGLPPQTRARPVTSRMPEGYLRCPGCSKFMNRMNFARVSGVLLDSCRAHGIWFDTDELQHVLDFIEKGGLEITARREAEEQAARLRQIKLNQAVDEMTPVRAKMRLMELPVRTGSSVLRVLLDLLRS